uniref:Actin maturation protease n=1 Tax=Globodera pallida TaxID=36090 RepID=A0A183BLM5_GLOPA
MFAEIDGQHSVLFRNRLEALIRTHGEAANVHVFVHQMRSELQKGPTCGFAALLMALRCSQCQLAEEVTLQHLVEMGKSLGFTYQGELFSAAWMCELVDRLWPKKYQLKLTQFPTANAIIQHLISGESASERRCPTTVLVPYDCDKNFEPCNRQGNAAHWALIIGFVLLEQSVQNGEEIHSVGPRVAEFNAHNFFGRNFDNEHLLYLVALQGKSRHPALWSYSALRESNGQLNVPTPKGNFRLAPEGLAAIKGKCVLFCGSKVEEG